MTISYRVEVWDRIFDCYRTVWDGKTLEEGMKVLDKPYHKQVRRLIRTTEEVIEYRRTTTKPKFFGTGWKK